LPPKGLPTERCQEPMAKEGDEFKKGIPVSFRENEYWGQEGFQNWGGDSLRKGEKLAPERGIPSKKVHPLHGGGNHKESFFKGIVLKRPGKGGLPKASFEGQPENSEIAVFRNFGEGDVKRGALT